MSRHTTPATVGDGGDGLARILARRWLVQFENGEAVRRYQDPSTSCCRSTAPPWPPCR